MNPFLSTFSILFLLSAGIQVEAQISYGARVGINFSNVAIDYKGTSKSYDNRIGIALGFFTEIDLSNRFALQPEVLFSQHRMQYSRSEVEVISGKTRTTSEEVKYKFSYLQIPLFAKLKLGTERLGFHILAGPYLANGMGIAQREMTHGTTINGNPSSETYEYVIDSWKRLDLKTFDYGFTGGVGIFFLAGRGTLIADARYQLGLANFSNHAERSFKNRNIQFGLCYILPMRG